MHIAIDARIINSTTGRYVERLISHLEQIDKTNDYSILVRQKDVDFWKPTNPNFHIMAADFDNYSFAEQIGFKKFLDNLAPDLVHFCMPQQPVRYKGLHVTTIHDLTLLNTYNSDKNWLVFHIKQLVGRYVFKKIAITSKFIITPTNYVKKAFVEFAKISSDKVVVTYEAAEIDSSASKPYKVPFKQFILYVGQQSDYKNIKRLGDAHQKLLETYPDLGLVLVGKKNASALKNEAYFVKSGYKNIHFTNFVPDDQLNWLFQNCTAYVFPSLMEGFGLPGLEAMAHGTPVVSSNATCLPEVYGDAARYFDPTDTLSMSLAINEVLDNPELRDNLAKKGKQKVAEYSWLRMAQQTHEVYTRALKG
jgi:glycosyltransferase involved in cell wall biosynthesis